MISIGSAMSELERCHRLSAAAMDSYTAALRSMAQYVVEVDESLTAPHRRHLSALAEEVVSGKPEALEESRATLRGLLRDYRDKAAHFLAGLRDDLAATARTLEEILDSLAQNDGDHESRLRSAVRRLRELANGPFEAAVRTVIMPATEVIEDCLEKIHKQHQLTIAQFQAEIHMLHQRIDTLETTVSIDQMTTLLNRAEMEDRVRNASPPFCILMVKVQGFRLAEARYGRDAGAECIAAFAKRLRSGMPPSAEVGRWGYEEFLAILHTARAELMPIAKWVTEHLSGSYSCLQNGKTVRPQLQASAAVLESGSDSPAHILSRVSEFLGGPGR
ncbi:MAG: GGDEF domain-containing protein [Bryobacteraceae bacterium]